MKDAAPEKDRPQKNSYGLRRGKRVYEGYNDERKVADRKKKEKQRLGYEVFARDFSRVNNELPCEYRNKIITGDSAEVLAGMPDNCVDIVMTSPPYNFGLDYNAQARKRGGGARKRAAGETPAPPVVRRGLGAWNWHLWVAKIIEGRAVALGAVVCAQAHSRGKFPLHPLRAAWFGRTELAFVDYKDCAVSCA